MPSENTITAILNIGLNWTDSDGTERTHSAIHAYRVLQQANIQVLHAVQRDSDSEPTLIVRCLVDRACFNVYEVARDLEQDCIAVWCIDDQCGTLIGPRTERWGTFNPSHFITLDGERLSDHIAKEG